MNKTLAAARHRVASRIEKSSQYVVRDRQHLKSAYTPAREGRTAHKGPAESDNPKSKDCTPRQLPCRVANTVEPTAMGEYNVYL